MEKIIHIKNQEEMAQFAKDFAQNPPKIIALKGTLGAGKSFFAKNFINELQENKTDILSPTFNIALTYDTKLGEVYHFDLYRLKSKDELENVGFFESLKNNICLIEWPEIALNYLKTLPGFALLELDIAGEEERKIAVSSNSVIARP